MAADTLLLPARGLCGTPKDVVMPSLTETRPVLKITGLVYALIGLALAGGGVWLALLGGSAFYSVAGLGILATGVLLMAGRWSALWVYAAVLIGTQIWAVSEVGFDWWPLAARGDVIFPLGVGLLTPWITRNLHRGTSARSLVITLPLWVGVVAGLAVLAIGFSSNYHDIDGVIAGDSSGVSQDPTSQPAEDWHDYGRTQFGQRYSPLTQITPANAKDSEGRLDIPHRRSPGQERPDRDDLRGHADQGCATLLYLCSQHQRLFALDAKTGDTALVLRSQDGGQSDIPASDLPRRLLS